MFSFKFITQYILIIIMCRIIKSYNSKIIFLIKGRELVGNTNSKVK